MVHEQENTRLTCTSERAAVEAWIGGFRLLAQLQRTNADHSAHKIQLKLDVVWAEILQHR